MTSIFNQGGSLRTTIPKKVADSLKLDSDDTATWISLGNIVFFARSKDLLDVEFIKKSIKKHLAESAQSK